MNFLEMSGEEQSTQNCNIFRVLINMYTIQKSKPESEFGTYHMCFPRCMHIFKISNLQHTVLIDFPIQETPLLGVYVINTLETASLNRGKWGLEE